MKQFLPILFNPEKWGKGRFEDGIFCFRQPYGMKLVTNDIIISVSIPSITEGPSIQEKLALRCLEKCSHPDALSFFGAFPERYRAIQGDSKLYWEFMKKSDFESLPLVLTKFSGPSFCSTLEPELSIVPGVRRFTTFSLSWAPWYYMSLPYIQSLEGVTIAEMPDFSLRRFVSLCVHVSNEVSYGRKFGSDSQPFKNMQGLFISTMKAFLDLEKHIPASSSKEVIVERLVDTLNFYCNI